MKMKFFGAFALLFSILLSLDTVSQVRPNAGPGWNKLGSRKVSRMVERDVMPIGPYEGAMRKLKVEVRGGTVYMRRMIVTYGNGAVDEIPLRYVFQRGSESRVIDLRGGNRVIKKITFIYDKKNTARGARVVVWGR